jgi:hypothetical protein
VLFSLLTWLGVACLMVFLLLAERRQVERKAESDALGVSTLLEARLAGILQRVQSDLEHLALSLPGEAFRRGQRNFGARVVRELGLRSRLFPEVAGFRVLDAAGNLLYASKGRVEGESFADRSYFKAFENGRGNGLFFSKCKMTAVGPLSSCRCAGPPRRRGCGCRGRQARSGLSVAMVR